MGRALGWGSAVLLVVVGVFFLGSGGDSRAACDSALGVVAQASSHQELMACLVAQWEFWGGIAVLVVALLLVAALWFHRSSGPSSSPGWYQMSPTTWAFFDGRRWTGDVRSIVPPGGGPGPWPQA